MKIKAAIATAPHAPFEVREATLDEPRDDEILVRIVAVGLCHTDISARDGILPMRLPAVLGHEGAGVVEAVGSSVTKVAPGDNVLLTFRSCGECDRCVAGEPTYCRHSVQLNYTGARPDGSTSLSADDAPLSSNFFGQSSFATHALAYERNAVKVAADAPLAIFAPLGCGIQTGAGAVLRALRCPEGSSLLITGAGPVGLSAVMAARHIAGCAHVIVSDPKPERRALATELGATDVIDPGDGRLNALVRQVLSAGVDYALDTTGVAAVMNGALQCLRPAGTLGMLGIPQVGDMPTPGLANAVLTYGLKIQGIIEGDSEPDVFIPELIEHHRAGRFPFDKMISTFPFDAINEAIEEQHAGRCTKAVLTM